MRGCISRKYNAINILVVCESNLSATSITLFFRKIRADSLVIGTYLAVLLQIIFAYFNRGCEIIQRRRHTLAEYVNPGVFGDVWKDTPAIYPQA